MIELPGLWSLTPIGFGIGVVALFYWLLATGRLVPRSLHDQIVASHKERGDGWKDTALKYQAANEILLENNGTLAEGTRTVEQLLRAAAPPFGDTARGGG